MGKVKKIGIVGHFAFGKEFNDGQTVKAKELANELERQLSSDEIVLLDTYGGVKRLPIIVFKTICLFAKCENVIMLPAHNGLKVFSPLFYALKNIFKRKIFYAVVGGWLPALIANKKCLKKCLMAFNAILVETSTMKVKLEEQGFNNICIMHNFKALSCDMAEVQDFCEPYKLCTFSRVMKEKGIEDAVNAVKHVNEKLGRTVYKLDIYGQVDSSQVGWFKEIEKQFPHYISYCGVVPFEKSTDALKKYFLLLFPTNFYTEGIPGTIIDSLASGVPVISSKWQNCDDILKDRFNGICYEFGKNEMLNEILIKVANEPENVLDMKKNCVHSFEKFMPKNAIKPLMELICDVDCKN